MSDNQLNLDDLIEAANQAGAEGAWIIRGSNKVKVKTTWPKEERPKYQPGETDASIGEMGFFLDLAPAGVVVVMRFPAGDGGEPGIESR
jgi:hypothetical protein